MSTGAIRTAAAVFLIGVLVVWLVRPVGDACPDLDRLPAGSSGSSAPSFAPPLTRTCTYTTPDGTKARRRYVPVVDWLALAVLAGVAGGAVGLLGPGRTERAPRAPREPRQPRARRPARAAAPPAVSGDGIPDADADAARRARDAAERERARREREARRRG